MTKFDEAYRKVRRLRGAFHAQRKDVARLRKQYEAEHQEAVRTAKAAFKPYDWKAAVRKGEAEQRRRFLEYRRLTRLYENVAVSQGKEVADQRYGEKLKAFKRPPNPPPRSERRGRPRTSNYVPPGKPSLPKRKPFGVLYLKSLPVVQNDDADLAYLHTVRALGLNVIGDLKAQYAKAISAVWAAYIEAFNNPVEAAAFCERRGIGQRADDPNGIRRLARLFVGEPVATGQGRDARWITDHGLVHRISRIVERLIAEEVVPDQVEAWLMDQGGVSAAISAPSDRQ